MRCSALYGLSCFLLSKYGRQCRFQRYPYVRPPLALAFRRDGSEFLFKCSLTVPQLLKPVKFFLWEDELVFLRLSGRDFH